MRKRDGKSAIRKSKIFPLKCFGHENSNGSHQNNLLKTEVTTADQDVGDESKFNTYVGIDKITFHPTKPKINVSPDFDTKEPCYLNYYKSTERKSCDSSSLQNSNLIFNFSFDSKFICDGIDELACNNSILINEPHNTNNKSSVPSSNSNILNLLYEIDQVLESRNIMEPLPGQCRELFQEDNAALKDFDSDIPKLNSEVKLSTECKKYRRSGGKQLKSQGKAKSHSLTYPQQGRRLAIVPDDLEEDGYRQHAGFHVFSPFYADWQKNCDALNYYKRRNSFPFSLGTDPCITDHGSQELENEKGRRTRWSIFNLFEKYQEKRNKSIGLLTDVEQLLVNTQVKGVIVEEKFKGYQNHHWSFFWPIDDITATNLPIIKGFRDAFWELFLTECDFYYGTLLVIKNVYLDPLKEIQVEGFLMDAEPEILFGNLEEICLVTYDFCSNLIGDLENHQFNPELLLGKLQYYNKSSEMGRNLKNVAYHKYCLNYLNSLNHLYILRNFHEFNVFEKWCKGQEESKKRSLSDLLISPVQHYMKIPLLYKNILKRASKCYLTNTGIENENSYVPDTIMGLDLVIADLAKSLESLEEKMKWMKNYKRLQEIDNLLVWPSSKSITKSNNIFAEVTKKRMNSNIRPLSISNPRRRIVHEGDLTMISIDCKYIQVRLFLFEDLVIITKSIKVISRKDYSPGTKKSASNLVNFEVINQFIDTDRFLLDDISSSDESAMGIKNIFIMTHLSRFNEILSTYLFQALNFEEKKEWVKKLRSLHKQQQPHDVKD